MRRFSDIDAYIAGRLKAAREESGLSMKRLAASIGCTWQQYQKYESGCNRVSGGRLYLIARALDRPVDYFFPKERSDYDEIYTTY